MTEQNSGATNVHLDKIRKERLSEGVKVFDPKEPLQAPGFTVFAENEAGDEVLNYACETRDDLDTRTGTCPSAEERPLVIAALKEALAFLGNPVVDEAV